MYSHLEHPQESLRSIASGTNFAKYASLVWWLGWVDKYSGGWTYSEFSETASIFAQNNGASLTSKQALLASFKPTSSASISRCLENHMNVLKSVYKNIEIHSNLENGSSKRISDTLHMK